MLIGLLFIAIGVALGGLMATVSSLSDKIVALSSDVTRVDALVKDLKDRAQNGAATQAEVDKLDSDLESVRQRLAEVK